jgi:hypothetical protein
LTVPSALHGRVDAITYLPQPDREVRKRHSVSIYRRLQSDSTACPEYFVSFSNAVDEQAALDVRKGSKPRKGNDHGSARVAQTAKASNHLAQQYLRRWSSTDTHRSRKNASTKEAKERAEGCCGWNCTTSH